MSHVAFYVCDGIISSSALCLHVDDHAIQTEIIMSWIPVSWGIHERKHYDGKKPAKCEFVRLADAGSLDCALVNFPLNGCRRD